MKPSHIKEHNRIAHDAVRHAGTISVGEHTAVILNYLVTADAAGTRIEMHSHVHCEVGIVTKGTVVYMFGKRKFTVRPGEAIVIPPKTPHIRSCSEQCVIHGFWIYMTGIPPGRDAVHVTNTDDASQFISSIHAEIKRGEAGLACTISHYIALVLIAVLRRLPPPASHTSARAFMLIRIRDAITFINDHLSEDMSAKVIAREFGISARHANRLFLEATGSTLHDFVRNTKMMTAYIALTRGRRTSVREIALSVGMRDFSYFSKCMKIFCGLTPSEIRSML
ncbi:MAG: AraC family transcriptional regulator [Spirochaetota bacterium]